MSDLSSATRLRLDNGRFPIVANIRYLRYLFAQCSLSRAGHGCRNQENPAVPLPDAGKSPRCLTFTVEEDRLVPPQLLIWQMVQLPMIALGKLPIMKKHKTVGNLTFWIGLMCGFPLL